MNTQSITHVGKTCNTLPGGEYWQRHMTDLQNMRAVAARGRKLGVVAALDRLIRRHEEMGGER